MGSVEPYRPAREGAGTKEGRGMATPTEPAVTAALHLVDDEGGGAPDLVIEGAGPAVVLLGVPVDGIGPPGGGRPP